MTACHEAKLYCGAAHAGRAHAESCKMGRVRDLGWVRPMLMALSVVLLCAGALGGLVFAAVQSADVRVMEAEVIAAPGRTLQASVIQYGGRYLLAEGALRQLGVAAPAEAYYYGSEAYYPLEDVPSLRLAQ